MRRAALCLLAITAPACNWVFGLDETLQLDAGAGPPTDGPLPIARLSWLVGVTDPTGMPVAMPELAPIVPAPTIKAGPLDGALEPLVYRADGTFELPYELAAAKYRFVYELPGAVPREMQWTPMAGRPAHAVVSRVGRIDRAAIPGPNASYSLTAITGTAPAPATHVRPRILTTGVWTESQPMPSPPPGPTFNYNFNSSIQLSGPPGAPESAKGDKVILINAASVAAGACTASTGSASYVVDLVDGVSTPTTSEPWSFATHPAVITGDGLDESARAASLPNDGGGVTRRTRIGATATTQLPAFSERVATIGLRSPVLLPLVDCTNANLGQLTSFGEPNALKPFDLLAMIQLTVTRTVAGGPILESGIASVLPVPASGVIPFDLAAAIPTPPFLLSGVDISTADGAPLSITTPRLVLSFGVEAGRRADYYDVTLHRVEGSSALPVRVYTSVEPSITIDPAELSTGMSYVFEIRSYLGAPDVAVADYSRYSPTQSLAATWSHTFVAQ